jgi:hypothetical protein
MVSYAEPQIDRNIHCMMSEGKSCKARALARAREKRRGGGVGGRDRARTKKHQYMSLSSQRTFRLSVCIYGCICLCVRE